MGPAMNEAQTKDALDPWESVQAFLFELTNSGWLSKDQVCSQFVWQLESSFPRNLLDNLLDEVEAGAASFVRGSGDKATPALALSHSAARHQGSCFAPLDPALKKVSLLSQKLEKMRIWQIKDITYTFE